MGNDSECGRCAIRGIDNSNILSCELEACGMLYANHIVGVGCDYIAGSRAVYPWGELVNQVIMTHSLPTIVSFFVLSNKKKRLIYQWLWLKKVSWYSQRQWRWHRIIEFSLVESHTYAELKQPPFPWRCLYIHGPSSLSVHLKQPVLLSTVPTRRKRYNTE